MSFMFNIRSVHFWSGRLKFFLLSYDLLAIDVLFHAEFLVICLGVALKKLLTLLSLQAL